MSSWPCLKVTSLAPVARQCAAGPEANEQAQNAKTGAGGEGQLGVRNQELVQWRREIGEDHQPVAEKHGKAMGHGGSGALVFGGGFDADGADNPIEDKMIQQAEMMLPAMLSMGDARRSVGWFWGKFKREETEMHLPPPVF
jgi:hypothetical protein